MFLPQPIEEGVPLAGLTTFQVGGPARFHALCRSQAELLRCLAWASDQDLPAFILGGGSNLLVADAGFPGLVLRLQAGELTELAGDGGGGAAESRGAEWLGEAAGEGEGRAAASGAAEPEVTLVAGASVPWDLVAGGAAARGLGGIECLSGIPGSTGAAPIQNIGAYGQEVAEAVAAVWVVDRASGERRRIPGSECGFGYRTSHFKTRWADRLVVVAVELRLRRGIPGAVRYAELEGRFAGRPAGALPPSPAAVRQEVLALRRAKSMLLDPADPNHRSAGSFFVNPTVGASELAAIREAARRLAPPDRPLPEHPAGEGRVKLPAAWLIEAAGFPRGYARGRAGLSSRHALALINRGGASARELIELAALIRTRVRAAFGVALEPEPVLLGFAEPVEELLGGG